MNTVSRVTGLLQRLHRFQEKTDAEHFAAVRDFLGRLRPRLEGFRAEAQRIEIETSPRFNVFRVLRLAHKEVQAHTPFIGELLNPQGTHGQGFVFLKSFLTTAQQRGLLVPMDLLEKNARWRVDIERAAGKFGNIDIVVRCSALRYLLVIENKVWADEQDSQLDRYSNWMETQQRSYDLRQIAFLTPTGRPSKTINSGAYVRLSYHDDIRRWLQEALDEVKSSAVREIVLQYLQVVEAC